MIHCKQCGIVDDGVCCPVEANCNLKRAAYFGSEVRSFYEGLPDTNFQCFFHHLDAEDLDKAKSCLYGLAVYSWESRHVVSLCLLLKDHPASELRRFAMIALEIATLQPKDERQSPYYGKVNSPHDFTRDDLKSYYKSILSWDEIAGTREQTLDALKYRARGPVYKKLWVMYLWIRWTPRDVARWIMKFF